LKPTCPCGADTQDLQIDPPGLGDRLFVGRTRRHDVLCEAVGPLDRAGGKVHTLGELVLDHVPVALGVPRGEADILVERECPGPGERETVLDVQPDELIIDRERAGAGRQAEHRVRSRPQQRADRACGELCELLGRCDNNLHEPPSLAVDAR